MSKTIEPTAPKPIIIDPGATHTRSEPVTMRADRTPTPPAEKPAAATPPAEPAVEPAVPTAEEAKANTEAAMEAAFGSYRKKPAPAPEPPAEPPAEPETPVASPEPTRKKPRVRKPAPAPEPEPPEPAAPTAEEIGQAVARSLKKEDAPVAPQLTDREKASLAVVRQLEKSNPTYAGLERKTVDFWGKEKAYIAAWEQQNQGEQFDPDATEHEAFYKKNEPSVDGEDMENAKLSILVDQQMQKRVNPELERIKQERAAEKAIHEAAPHIQHAAGSAVAQLVVEAVTEFKDIVVDKDGAIVLSAETIQKMREKNPVAMELIEGEQEQVGVLASELEKMTRLGAHYRADETMTVKLANGERIRPHAIILDASEELTNRIASKPRDQQVFEGKTFITAQNLDLARGRIIKAMNGEPREKIIAALGALDRKHWTVTVDDVREFLVRKSAKNIKQTLTRLETLSARKNGSATKPAANGHAQPPVAAPVNRGKPSAPSVSAASGVVDTTKRGSTDVVSEQKRVEALLFDS